MLYEYASTGKFKEAVRLCRFIKNPQLWATLAAMAIYHQDLDSAEIALSATREVDKLQYIKHIKSIDREEIRNSEMMVYKVRLSGASEANRRINCTLCCFYQP